MTWAYDALGRATSEAQSNGTVTSSYDAAGRRTQLAYPGGFTLTYASNDAGELTSISQSGTGVLATFHSDDVGRPDAVSRTGGGSIGYGYDARLAPFPAGHGGLGANTQSIGLAYNPAGQIISRSSSNTAYDWPYATAFTDSYGTANGLNQYPTARGLTISYDDRGNTTNDGTKGYTYDGMNQLVSASNGASAAYDPTGRLLWVSQGGTTTRFLYDGTRLIAEYTGTGALLHRYVHGPGTDQPIAWMDTAGNRNWLYGDERGSVIGVAGPRGGSVDPLTALNHNETKRRVMTIGNSERPKRAKPQIIYRRSTRTGVMRPIMSAARLGPK